MKTIIIIIITLGLSLGISGCDEWLTVQPATLITPEDLYASPAGYKDALTGCYQLMKPLYTYNGSMTTGTIEHLACMWEFARNSVEHKLGLHDYSDDKVDANMQAIFRNMYKVIANVNELIRALESQDGVLDEKLYSKYMGEALGLRAFLHLELMRLWGPMPSNVRLEKQYLPFVERIQIEPYQYLDYRTYMNKVQDDLQRAEQLLKNGKELRKDYINYYAVLALQARFHFWKGNKEEALDYGNRLLSPDTLSLFPLNKSAITGSTGTQTAFLNEAIFEYCFDHTKSTSITSYNYESYVIDYLFEGSGSDSRLYQWRKQMGPSPEKEDHMILNKYDIEKSPSAPYNARVTGYVPLIRISEIYLMMMELESIDRANELYAEFAAARGIATKVFTSNAELIKVLELEYQREFYGEGQMFFTYKRWGTIYIPRGERRCGESAYVPPIPRKEFDFVN